MLLEPHGLLRLRLRWSSAAGASRRASAATTTSVDDRSSLSVSPIGHKALTQTDSSTDSGAPGLSSYATDDQMTGYSGNCRESLFGGLDDDSGQEEELSGMTVSSWNGVGKDHKGLVKGSDEDDSPGNFVCKWENCDRERRPFKTHTMLVLHVRKHTGEKPHRCTYDGCNRSYTRLENLRTHIRLHQEEKLFTCEVFSCGKSFSNATTLDKHYDRVHGGGKNPPFECELEGGFDFYADPKARKQISADNKGKEASKRLLANTVSETPSEQSTGVSDQSDELQSSTATRQALLPPRTIKQVLAQQQLKDILNNAPPSKQPPKPNNNRPLVLQHLQDTYDKQQSPTRHQQHSPIRQIFPNWTIKKPTRPPDQKVNFDDEIEDDSIQKSALKKASTSADQRRHQLRQEDFEEIQRIQSQRINKYLQGQQKLRQVFDGAAQHSLVMPTSNESRCPQKILKASEDREERVRNEIFNLPRKSMMKQHSSEQIHEIGSNASSQQSSLALRPPREQQHLLKIQSFMTKSQSIHHLPSPQSTLKSSIRSNQFSPRMQELQQFFDKAQSMQHLSALPRNNNNPLTISDDCHSSTQNSALPSPAPSMQPLQKPRCVLPRIYFERTQSMQHLPPKPPPASEKPSRRQKLHHQLFDEEQFGKEMKAARELQKTNEEERESRRLQKSLSEKTKSIRRVQSERVTKPRHQRVQQIFNEAPPLLQSPSQSNKNELRRFPKLHLFSTDTDSELSHYQSFQHASRLAHRQKQIEDILDELESSSKERWSSSQQIMKESARQQQRQESFEKNQAKKQMAAAKGVVFSEFAELEF